MLIRRKKGIGDGLQPLPPEQEGGKQKTKVFYCREEHQLILCCYAKISAGVTLCPSLQWKTFVFNCSELKRSTQLVLWLEIRLRGGGGVLICLLGKFGKNAISSEEVGCPFLSLENLAFITILDAVL